MSKADKLMALMAPVHPGEILRGDFMKSLDLSVNKLALELHVPATRIGEIVHERRRITAETVLRLARYFKTNAEFWLNLQNFYDLECERRAGKTSEIERQVQPGGAEGAGRSLWLEGNPRISLWKSRRGQTAKNRPL